MHATAKHQQAFDLCLPFAACSLLENPSPDRTWISRGEPRANLGLEYILLPLASAEEEFAALRITKADS